MKKSKKTLIESPKKPGNYSPDDYLIIFSLDADGMMDFELSWPDEADAAEISIKLSQMLFVIMSGTVILDVLEIMNKAKNGADKKTVQIMDETTEKLMKLLGDDSEIDISAPIVEPSQVFGRKQR
jgi:hypothetical protein